MKNKSPKCYDKIFFFRSGNIFTQYLIPRKNYCLCWKVAYRCRISCCLIFCVDNHFISGDTLEETEEPRSYYQQLKYRKGKEKPIQIRRTCILTIFSPFSEKIQKEKKEKRWHLDRGQQKSESDKVVREFVLWNREFKVISNTNSTVISIN